MRSKSIIKAQETGDRLKKDVGKAPINLLPYEFIEGVANVLAVGAKKYAPYGWADKSMDYSRIIAAAYRHLGKFEKGEDLDRDDNLHHMLHLSCCAMFLFMYYVTGLGRDNRWKRPIRKD